MCWIEDLKERLEMYKKEAQEAHEFYEELNKYPENYASKEDGITLEDVKENIEKAHRDYQEAEDRYRQFVKDVSDFIATMLEKYPEI